MKVIATYIEKGGAGKSMAVFQMAGFLARAGKRVLVVDADVQSNTSNTLLTNTNLMDDEDHPAVCDVLTGKIAIEDAIFNAPIETKAGQKPKDIGIDVFPSNKRKEIKFYSGAYALKEQLEKVADRYDFCLIDFPPERPYVGEDDTFNLVSLGLIASDVLLIPCTPDEDSFSGLEILMEHVSSIRNAYNPGLNVLGCFLNNYTDCDNDRYIKSFCENTLTQSGMYSGCCVRASGIAKASRTKYRPVAWYYATSPVAEDYRKLTETACGIEIGKGE